MLQREMPVKEDEYRALTTGNFQSRLCIIDFQERMVDAENPATPARDLLRLESDANDWLGAKLTPASRANVEQAQDDARQIRAAVYRNPNYPERHLRPLLAAGDPDAWLNPAVDLMLLDAPMSEEDMLRSLIVAALRVLAAEDPHWSPLLFADFGLDRLVPYYAQRHSRLRGRSHPFLRKWQPWIDGRLNPSPRLL